MKKVVTLHQIRPIFGLLGEASYIGRVKTLGVTRFHKHLRFINFINKFAFTPSTSLTVPNRIVKSSPAHALQLGRFHRMRISKPNKFVRRFCC